MPEQRLRQAALRAGRTFSLGMPVTTGATGGGGGEAVVISRVERGGDKLTGSSAAAPFIPPNNCIHTAHTTNACFQGFQS